MTADKADKAAQIALLVPRGAEYQAVRRGLTKKTDGIVLAPIAMGQAAGDDLDTLLTQPPACAIVLGLGGSLSPKYRPGDVMVCSSCIELASGRQLSCDRALTHALLTALRAIPSMVTTATGLTSDRVVCTATEKQRLGERYGAAVVDMEGVWVLGQLQRHGIPVGMVRVISDDTRGDIPDLSRAIATDGALRPLALAGAMGRSPRAALRLIRGSLRGLAVLRQVATQLKSLS